MNKIIASQKLLKYTYGIVVLVIGLDKLFRTDLLVNWEMYVSPQVAAMLPVSVGTFLAIISIVEIIVGIGLLTKWTRLFAYVSALWLVLISINLLMLGYVDIAARDIVLAVGAITLAWLTEETEQVQ